MVVHPRVTRSTGTWDAWTTATGTAAGSNNGGDTDGSDKIFRIDVG